MRREEAMIDRIDRDKISKKIENLLRQFGIKRPPVPVEKLVKKLGLLLVPLPADDEISGAIIRNGKEVVIAVNPTHHTNRQRFPITHELRHYFLHYCLE